MGFVDEWEYLYRNNSITRQTFMKVAVSMIKECSLFSRILIIWGMACFAAPLISQEYTLHMENFSKESYNAEFQNWSIDKGWDNLVYVANNAGLLEFDGVNWDFYDAPWANNLRAVGVDSINQRIYSAGYRELGFWERDSLGVLNYQSLSHHVYHEFDQNEEFWKIIALPGKVIFQSFSGLFIYNPEQDTFTLIRPQQFVNSITRVNDEIFVHVYRRGIYKLAGDSIQPVIRQPELDDKLVRFILPDRSGSLLIGTASNGIYQWDGRRLIPRYEELQGYFSENTINRGAIFRDSLLLVGTILDGMTALTFSGEVRFRVNEENGLQNNTVLGMKTGDESIWLSLDRGISYIHLRQEPAYRTVTISKTGAVYDAAFYDERLYLATNQGLYYRPRDAENQEFQLIPYTQGQVWDCEVIDDQLFVNHNTGAFVINGEEVRKISDIAGGFRVIKNPLQYNTLIQCTYTHLNMFRKEQGEWNFSHSFRNFYDLIRYIELDHLNNLWASHMRRGIFKLELNDRQDSVVRNTYYGRESVFGKDNDLHVFKLENRIVFTSGHAIYTYNDLDDTIVRYDELNRELEEYATAHRIIKAPDHHYWFITQDHFGLFHFQPHSIKKIGEFPHELFGHHFIEGYENVVPVDTRRALICMENGYAMVDASKIRQQTAIRQQKLTLKRVVRRSNAGEEKLLPLDSMIYELPYGKNNLTLRFGFPYYTSSKLSYRYYIEGLNQWWSKPLDQPVFDLTRIPAGFYVVHVRAENAWGETSKTYQMRVRVLPPWYRSTLAFIIYFILLLAVVLLVRYVSVKRIRKREKHKRELKEQELIKLRNENLRNELSFKSRELANSTMSIIKKNEFLLDLKEILKNQKYELGTRYPDKYYRHIVNKIDKNISSGDDWKIFETNIEKAHDRFIQKMLKEYPQLSHSDLRLCTYLRMNLSTKEIAPLLRISVRGVENHRYRLRKKLNLDPEENLTDFILAFEV